MTPELVGVIGLVAIFAIAMWRKINMGAVALVVALLLGTFYFHVDAKEISAGFPGNLLVTLVGVTFFFGLARANGTVNKVVDGAVSLVSGRAALIPWVFFILAAVITGSGAISAATNAILIPVGLAFATRYRINPVLIGFRSSTAPTQAASHRWQCISPSSMGYSRARASTLTRRRSSS